MTTLESIYQRRAVKQFDPDHRLTEEEEKTLLEATIQAPTSFNIQHWRFVILRDPELRSKIRTEFGNDQAATETCFTRVWAVYGRIGASQYQPSFGNQGFQSFQVLRPGGKAFFQAVFVIFSND